jgi:hypothetical protein
MTTERQPLRIEDRRSKIADRRRSSILYLLSSILGSLSTISIIAVALLILTACGLASDDANTPADQSGGSRIGAENVAQNFFDDLRNALKDPKLADDTVRSRWAAQLASYFAPNERDDQQAALNTALSTLASGLGRLGPDQTLTIELRITAVQKISDDSSRALVRPVNGTANASIYLLIAHVNDRGVQIPDFEQEVGFDKIIGRADGAIPTIKIGDRWYLTEG